MIEIDDNCQPYINHPKIENITMDDFRRYYKTLLRQKPKQISIGEFYVGLCPEHCAFKGIVHNKQAFCPVCKSLLIVQHDDANYDFDKLFREWNNKIKYVERIINGKVDFSIIEEEPSQTIDELNIQYKKEDLCYLGEEVIVDETY